MLLQDTLWHQEQVRAAARQAIRSEGQTPCECGNPSTIFDVSSCIWRCAACAQRELAEIRASLAGKETLAPSRYKTIVVR